MWNLEGVCLAMAGGEDRETHAYEVRDRKDFHLSSVEHWRRRDRDERMNQLSG